MGRMSRELLPKSLESAPGTALAGVYTRVTLWYLLAIWVMWLVGVEGIYGHPYPFYALVMPVFTSMSFSGSLFLSGAAVLLVTSLVIIRNRISTLDWFRMEPDRPQTRRLLLAIFAFAVLFPIAIAMIRNGPAGISQAYDRQAYEYIKDIGLGGSIRGLFRDFVQLHPYLSMHAQVHPPGPIAILWLFSYGVGQSPMALSIATILFGALSVFPMYWWARELFATRTALTCTLLYAFVPSIVIFSATSADITFMPFTLLTLYYFQRAIGRSSPVRAFSAGVLYGILSLISFSLVSIGAYFAFIGILRLRNPDTRRSVIQTALLMIAGLVALHVAVWLWSGFNVVEVFQISKAKFETDQRLLDLYDPRYPSWTWKFGNPLCWFFFAGIPVSVLCAWRMLRTENAARGLFYAFGATLLAFDILYLARGEGERSAMYIMPFLVIPAGHLLDEFGAATRSPVPLVVTVAFLGLQSLAIESILYTYW